MFICICMLMFMFYIYFYLSIQSSSSFLFTNCTIETIPFLCSSIGKCKYVCMCLCVCVIHIMYVIMFMLCISCILCIYVCIYMQFKALPTELKFCNWFPFFLSTNYTIGAMRHLLLFCVRL